MNQLGPLTLLVEDEPQMRRFLRTALVAHGFRLLETTTASEALMAVTSHNPELILLDLGLPDIDGLEVIQKIRGWSSIPIIVISARGREDDKVAALDAGADDYLTKPFGVNELLARVRVALRHFSGRAASVLPQQFELGDISVDLIRRQLRRGNQEIHLTPTEYRLLTLLARHRGKVLTHRQILKEVWGPGYAEQTHYVRVHMAELRKKIELNPARPKLLVTEPGVGYRLRDAD